MFYNCKLCDNCLLKRDTSLFCSNIGTFKIYKCVLCSEYCLVINQFTYEKFEYLSVNDVHARFGDDGVIIFSYGSRPSQPATIICKIKEKTKLDSSSIVKWMGRLHNLIIFQ